MPGASEGAPSSFATERPKDTSHAAGVKCLLIFGEALYICI